MHFWNCYQGNYKLLWQWWGQSLHFLFSSPFGRAQIWDLPRSKIKPIWISKVKVLTTYKSWRNIHLFHRTSRRMLLGFEFSFDRRNISTYIRCNFFRALCCNWNEVWVDSMKTMNLLNVFVNGLNEISRVFLFLFLFFCLLPFWVLFWNAVEIAHAQH